MHRTPRGLVTAGLAVVFALSSGPLMAQDQGNQRGQRGPGGPGGPGGWGGPGGRGGAPSIPMLLQQDAVQADLKLTDAQKEQVRDITAKASAKRDETFRKMQADRGNQRNNNNNGDDNQQGNDRREAFRAVMEQMNVAQQETEAALAKVLNPTQKSRVKQIALQVEGPQAFVGESLSTKLTLEEEQVESIRGILDDLRSQQRDLMASTFGFGGGRDRGGDNNNGDRGNNRGDRGDRGNNNRGGDRGDRANTTNNGGDRGNNRGGDNTANGGDRGNNRGGDNNANGGNRPRFDFNDPANQAKMAQMGKDRLKLNDKAMAAIAKVLGPAQRSLYTKMVGAKFDVSKIDMRRPGGPGGPPPTSTVTATTTQTTTPTATAPADAASKPATNAARPKSLSERRAAGAGGNKPN